MKIVRRHHRVLVHGITGKQGTFWTRLMRDCGTQVVGGVNPKKAGTDHCGVPVYASAVAAADALRDDGGFDVSVLFIPPLGVKEAALDAIQAGAKNLCILTEHIPVQDVMIILSAAGDRGTDVTGPNTAGSVTVGECFLGFMPASNRRIFKPGSIGVISRSGSLGTLMCQNIVSAGFGQSAFIGIGGDPIVGTTVADALQALDRFDGTKAVVMVGEIGGAMEEEAADYAATMDKPVIAFIAGGAAPQGRKMGHAGAIVIGDAGTYESKQQALAAAGVTVLATPSHVGAALKERVGT